MPHVSRHTPTRKVSNLIFERFVELVTTKGSAQERKVLLVDLLTPTERIMFSKRFAIIYMLSKGYSFDTIQDTLRVSPSTVARIWQVIQKGKYSSLIKRMNHPQAQVSILLEFLADLVPPMHMSKKQYAERMRRLGF